MMVDLQHDNSCVVDMKYGKFLNFMIIPIWKINHVLHLYKFVFQIIVIYT